MASGQRRVDRETLLAAYDTWEAAEAQLAGMSHEVLTHTEQVALLARRERLARQRAAVDHGLLAGLQQRADPAALGGHSLRDVLIHRLRLSGEEAGRRLRDANNLGPRRALDGQPLAPTLAATAAALAAGTIGPDHVRIITKFVNKLPGWIDATTRDQAEHTLAGIAANVLPEELREAAERLALLLDQDGPAPSDAERARKRGLRLSKQRPDGLSEVHGLLDPEARATLEAVFGTWAAPGMCNPDDETPCVDGTPDEQTVRRDTRTVAQRNHDALKAMGRSVLASGQLGHHNGLPATIVVTTTLGELESAAGLASTGGASLLPMSDVIRLASHAHHYLVVYQDHTEIPLYLGRSRRTASPGQRLVLYARDRGCTRPGCTQPAYNCQAHHATTDWAHGGNTNIDELTLTCKPDHRLMDNGWKTRTRKDGRTEWLPPPHLDAGQPRINNYHHPQRYLAESDDNPDDEPG